MAELSELKLHEQLKDDSQTVAAVNEFNTLLQELRKKNLSGSVEREINRAVRELNASTDGKTTFNKLLKQRRFAIVRLVEKEHKIVPKGYYRKLWLSLGMAAFGLPLGVAFGTALHNTAYIALGLPLGLAIGSGIGRRMDKKAAEEGRQLNIELKGK
ncbi:MAG: hypothetical protein EAS48_01330 [Chryseobacterium sp.]|nr:MAG: hypothetical protein EAS48_01330 [Chryseobacterium sp.]